MRPVPLALALLGAVGLGPAALAAPAPLPAGDWPLWRGDVQNRAFIRLRTTTPTPIRAWRFRAGSHVWGYQPGMSVWSSPAVGLVRGQPVLFVGSYDHNVYALDARTGRKRWRFATGGGVYSTPVLWHAPDGRSLLFVPSSDRMVYALDADLGRREWIFTVETWRPTIGGARLSSPAVGRVGGRPALFVGHWVWDKSVAGYMQAGGLSAIDALSGNKLWTAALGDNQVSSPLYSETPGGGRVFVASENGNLYALDAGDGAVIWAHTERDAVMASPALFRLGDRVFVVIGSKFGLVRCLDAERGATVWTYKTGHWVDGSAAVATIGGRLTVLVGSYDTHLHALDAASGRPIWRYRTAGGIYASPAVAADGKRVRVLFTSWDHHLHCLDGVDGSLLWNAFLGRPIWDSVSLGDSIWSSPVVAEIDGQQVAYVGTYAGPLYAIPLAEAAKKALARPSSNIDFWLTMPIVLIVVTAMTLLVTRHHRRRRR
jgi:outer membrane protein assembly factor BamB